MGTFGEIGFESTPDGRVLAMARYRDDDGKLRRVKATADTARAAERLLKSRLAKRSHQGGNGELRPDSTFGQLVEVWLEDLDLEDRLAPTTRALYERNMRQLVVPAFENFQLREITVSKVDRFLKSQRQRSYSIAKQSKVVLSLAFGLAVRYEAMPRNPVRETARLSRPAVQAKALRHRLTISEDAWFLETSSLPAPARSKVSLQPPPTPTCGIRPTATSL